LERSTTCNKDTRVSSSIIDAMMVALASLDYVDYRRQIETEVLLPAAPTMSGYPDV
jgi:hypothetical protein